MNYELPVQPPTVTNVNPGDLVAALKPHHRFVLERIASQSDLRGDIKLYSEAASKGVAPNEVDKAKGAERAMEFAQSTANLPDDQFEELVRRIQTKVQPQQQTPMPGLENPNLAQGALAAYMALTNPEHAYDLAAVPFQQKLREQQEAYQRNLLSDKARAEAGAQEADFLQDVLRMRNQRDIAELGADSRADVATIRAESQAQVAALNAAIKQQGIDLQSLGLELREKDFNQKVREYEEIKKPESGQKIEESKSRTAVNWAREADIRTLTPAKFEKLTNDIQLIKDKSGYIGKQGELLDKKIANYDAEFAVRAANIYSQIGKRASDAAKGAQGDERKAENQKMADLNALIGLARAQIKKLEGADFWDVEAKIRRAELEKDIETAQNGIQDILESRQNDDPQPKNALPPFNPLQGAIRGAAGGASVRAPKSKGRNAVPKKPAGFGGPS